MIGSGQAGGQKIASATVFVTILTTILVLAAFLVPIICSGKLIHKFQNFLVLEDARFPPRQPPTSTAGKADNYQDRYCTRFVICHFFPHMQFLVEFFSTQKGVNRDKNDFYNKTT